MFISPRAPDLNWRLEDQTRLAEAVKETRQAAEAIGNELITVSAIVTLFGIKKPSVHQAIRLERVSSFADLRLADRRLRLVSLTSARAFWGRGDDFDIDQRLAEFRADAPLFWISGQAHLILHNSELIYLTYPGREIA